MGASEGRRESDASGLAEAELDDDAELEEEEEPLAVAEAVSAIRRRCMAESGGMNGGGNLGGLAALGEGGAAAAALPTASPGRCSAAPAIEGRAASPAAINKKYRNSNIGNQKDGKSYGEVPMGRGKKVALLLAPAPLRLQFNSFTVYELHGSLGPLQGKRQLDETVNRPVVSCDLLFPLGE